MESEFIEIIKNIGYYSTMAAETAPKPMTGQIQETPKADQPSMEKATAQDLDLKFGHLGEGSGRATSGPTRLG